MSSIIIVDSSKCRFLDLPLEIRQMIFSYFWNKHEAIRDRLRPSGVDLPDEQLALRMLAQTCKTLHEDALKTYYAHIPFCFYSTDDMKTRLEVLGPIARRYIRNVELYLQGEEEHAHEAFGLLSESRTLRRLWLNVDERTMNTSAEHKKNLPDMWLERGLELVRGQVGVKCDFQVRERRLMWTKRVDGGHIRGHWGGPPKLYSWHTAGADEDSGAYEWKVGSMGFGVAASQFPAGCLAQFQEVMGEVLRRR